MRAGSESASSLARQDDDLIRMCACELWAWFRLRVLVGRPEGGGEDTAERAEHAWGVYKSVRGWT